ncbi:Os12g0141900, partial [Oryza sativa Japonica Group]
RPWRPLHTPACAPAFSTTVSALKEFILARWPQDKEITPKTVNDLKLINAGRILENNRTLVESRVRVEVPGGVITMHVVVHPPQSDKNKRRRNKNQRTLWAE